MIYVGPWRFIYSCKSWNIGSKQKNYDVNISEKIIQFSNYFPFKVSSTFNVCASNHLTTMMKLPKKLLLIRMSFMLVMSQVSFTALFLLFALLIWNSGVFNSILLLFFRYLCCKWNHCLSVERCKLQYLTIKMALLI